MDIDNSVSAGRIGQAREDALLSSVAREIAAASEGDKVASIALVDIDEFGRLNREHGESVGDRILQLLEESLAQINAPGASVLHQSFRAGGDEFVVMMPGTQKEDAFLALERAREAFAQEHAIADGTKKLSVKATFSAAVSTFPDDGVRAQEVLRKASDALYRAKSLGRNRVCLAKEERMVTKTSHYTQAQLARLSQLAKAERVGEAVLLREALDSLLRRHGV